MSPVFGRVAPFLSWFLLLASRAEDIRVALFPPFVADRSVRSVHGSRDLAAAVSAQLSSRDLAGIQWVERTEIRRVLEERSLALGLLEGLPDPRGFGILRADVALVGEFATNQTGMRTLRLRALDLSTGDPIAERQGASPQAATGPLRPEGDLATFVSAECEALLQDVLKARRRGEPELRVGYLFHRSDNRTRRLNRAGIAERIFAASTQVPRLRPVFTGNTGLEFAEAGIVAARDPEGPTETWTRSVDRFVWTEETRDASGSLFLTVHHLGQDGLRSRSLPMMPEPDLETLGRRIRDGISGSDPTWTQGEATPMTPSELANLLVESVRSETFSDSSSVSVEVQLDRLRRLELAVWLVPESLPALREIAERRWPFGDGPGIRDRHRFAVLRAEAWKRVVELERTIQSPAPGAGAFEAGVASRRRDADHERAFRAIRAEIEELDSAWDDMTAVELERRSNPALAHLLEAVDLFEAAPALRIPENAGAWLESMLRLTVGPELRAADRLHSVEKLADLVPLNWFQVGTGIEVPAVAEWISKVSTAARDPERGRRLLERLVTAPRTSATADVAPATGSRGKDRPAPRLKLPRFSEVFPTTQSATATAPIRIQMSGKSIPLEPVALKWDGREPEELLSIAGNGGEVFVLTRFRETAGPSPIEVGGAERLPSSGPPLVLFRQRGDGPMEKVADFVGQPGAGLLMDGEGRLLVSLDTPREVNLQGGGLGAARRRDEIQPALPIRLESGALRMGNFPEAKVVLRGAFSLPDLQPGDFSTPEPGLNQLLREASADRRNSTFGNLLKGRRRGEFGRVRMTPLPGIQAADATRIHLGIPSTDANLVTLDLATGMVVSAVQVPGGFDRFGLGARHLWLILRRSPSDHPSRPRLVRVARSALERPRKEWTSPEVPVEEWSRLAEALPPAKRDFQLVFGGCERRFVELHRDFNPEAADDRLLFLMAVAYDPQGLNDPKLHRQRIADLRRRFPRSPFAPLFPATRPAPRPDIVDPQ
jgi:hypothetical protein